MPNELPRRPNSDATLDAIFGIFSDTLGSPNSFFGFTLFYVCLLPGFVHPRSLLYTFGPLEASCCAF